MNPSEVNPYAPPSESTADAPPPAVLGEPITLRGEVGLELYLRAHRLARGNVRIGWQLPVTFAVVAAMAVIVIVQRARDGTPLGIWIYLVFTVLLVFVIALLMLWNLSPWQLKRAFARGDLKPQQASWTISDEGVHAVTDTVDSHEKWANYQSWRASDDLILLYGQGRLLYLPLAREFCPRDGDWHRLRDFLQAKLPENKG
jgi:hypothetical protein